MSSDRSLTDPEERIEDLRAELQVGIDELNRGLGVPLDMQAIKAEARKVREARERDA